MEKLNRDKGLFIGLSCLSIGCLIGSFGYPLQKLEIYTQSEVGHFGVGYERRFILTENEMNYPYGFIKDRAVRIAAIYQDYKAQKIMLLVLAALCSFYALQVGSELVPTAEIEHEISELKAQGKKELILEGIKHRLALASKSQRLLFLDEMKALMEEFGGGQEQEILEADEINALYEEATEDKEDSKANVGNTFREKYPESMDESCWKVISKALQGGATDEEILRDVLGDSSSVARAYVEYLRQEYSRQLSCQV